jgi:hypothetical protein
MHMDMKITWDNVFSKRVTSLNYGYCEYRSNNVFYCRVKKMIDLMRHKLSRLECIIIQACFIFSIYIYIYIYIYI